MEEIKKSNWLSGKTVTIVLILISLFMVITSVVSSNKYSADKVIKQQYKESIDSLNTVIKINENLGEENLKKISESEKESLSLRQEIDRLKNDLETSKKQSDDSEKNRKNYNNLPVTTIVTDSIERAARQRLNSRGISTKLHR